MRGSPLFLMALSVATLPGCGTLEATRQNKQGLFPVYGGVRLDCQVFGEARPLGDYFLRALDLPVSFVADTTELGALGTVMGAGVVAFTPMFIGCSLGAGLESLGVSPAGTKIQVEEEKRFLSGVVLEREGPPGWREVGLDDPPASGRPLKAELKVVRWNGSERLPSFSITSDSTGRFALRITPWVDWKWIEVRCEHYEPFEISLPALAPGGGRSSRVEQPGPSDITSASDTAFWNQHRLEILLKRRD